MDKNNIWRLSFEWDDTRLDCLAKIVWYIYLSWEFLFD